MKARTLVIGDIHGAFRALAQVLERAEVTQQDTLIFLGDYVDGWSQSRQVIAHLLNLSESHNCIFMRGNHDTWCEGWLRRRDADLTWLLHGGSSSVDSYDVYDEEVWQRHLGFFERLKDYHVDEKNRLFIHAGYTSMHGPAREMYSTNFSWDRTLWEMAVAMDPGIKKDSVLYPKRLKHFAEIYLGHTPTMDYKSEVPMNAANVWNIDTGAAFRGKLSLLDADTKEYWQSDVVKTLYPGEKGRNKD
ncbi:MAG: serine/threonine protein phosphatase [Bacteroidetes bacterium]|nr:serine/threonine protein phosphatase [Bacteroidota bacterium]